MYYIMYIFTLQNNNLIELSDRIAVSMDFVFDHLCVIRVLFLFK